MSSRSRPRKPKPSKSQVEPSPRRRSGWARIASILSATLLLVVAGIWWIRRPPRFVLPPPDHDMNVVLVTIDTLRSDMLSCYGGPVPTPNLDALAAHGARFTFAHAHAVVTLVSHTSILTGELPYEHGIRDNSGFRVAAGTQTAATRLKAAGFATGAFIGGYPLTKRFGLSPGFDEYDDQLPEEHGVGGAFSLPERRAEEVVARAVSWVHRQTGPFFGWIHVYDPHAPYTPPPPYLEEFQDHPYYGEIAYTDHALGKLFDELATRSRPTLVLVTADHGESLGEHGELTHGMFAYEATLHIPLIVTVVQPAGSAQAMPAAVTIDAPVTHIDLLPTILDAVALPPEQALKGRTLRDLIRTGRQPDRPSYFEAMTFNLTRGWAPLRGVLDGRNKFIDLPIPELFNLHADPNEQTNLAPTEPDRLSQFHTQLVAFNVAPPKSPLAESAKVQANLGSLGYLSARAPTRTTYTAADDPKTLMPIDHEVHVAQDLYEHGHIDEAIARMSRVMDAHPALGDVAVYLAYAQWEHGQPKAAIATLERALANHASDSNVVIRLGIYLAETHTDPLRAIALLETLPSTNVEALNGLGVAQVDANRPQDAVATFRRLLALDPTNGLALQNIASIQLKEAQALGAKDPRRAAALQEAAQSIEQALEADPSLPDAYNTKAVILVTLGQVPAAIECWKNAVRLDPQDFEALDNLIIALNDSHQTSDALTYARQFVQTAPPERFAGRIAELRRFIGG